MDRGPGCYAKVSSNLLRPAGISLPSGHRHFCANLLNLSKFRCRVKPGFCGNQVYNSFILGRQVYLPIRSTWRRGYSAAEGRTAQNFKQRPASIRLAPQRRTKGFSSRVMQWVCSLRDSLQGLDELYASYPPYEPASHFPQFKPCCAQKGQAQRPPGGSTATSATFQE